MKQPYCQQLARLWLLLATLFLAACGGKEGPPDEAAIKQAVNAANELVYDGQAQLAIDRLEGLQAQVPNNPLVIESLGFAYAKLPDPGMAALYFDQAYQLSPENHALALYAAQAYLESGNPQGAAETYRQYLDNNPADAEAWKALGRAEMELRRNQDALNAFLEAFRQSREPPTHEEAAIIGHLQHAVGNEAQAAKWYLQALRPGGTPGDRLTAQLGLFDLALAQQEWARAVELMGQIEQEFPGELASGPYASARTELIKWQNAQNALAQTTIARNIAEIPAGEIPAGEEPAAEVATVEEPAIDLAAATPPEPPMDPTPEELLALAESMPSVSASSVTVTEDTAETTTTVAATTVEESETMVGEAVAEETTEPETATVASSDETPEPATTTAQTALGNLGDPDDPATAKLRPSTAMVDLTEEVQAGGIATVTETTDEGELAATDITMEEAGETSVTETTLTTITESADGSVSVTEIASMDEVDSIDGETVEMTETEPTNGAEVDGETAEETVEEGVIAIDLPDPNMSSAERASLAFDAGDYRTAIRFYRQALATDDNNAQLAYDLSRAYFENRQYREAGIYAAEAMRIEPDNVRYTLNYLRAIQRTVSRDTLMRELVRAKEKFPTNPDVTLALGRAYEIIMGNTRNARFLYEEFVALAPDHPRAAEIREKLTRLPR